MYLLVINKLHGSKTRPHLVSNIPRDTGPYNSCDWIKGVTDEETQEVRM